MSKPLKILLVDDNPNDRQLVIHHLEEEFPLVEVTQIIAADGLAAALGTGAFDVVITDFQIRWTTGLEVLQAVKAGYPDCPVIMFTATGTQEIAVEAMKSGLDDYLIKAPAHYARLPVAVSSVLEKTRLVIAQQQNQADLRRKNAELELLHSLNQAVNRGEGLAQILTTLSAESKKIFDCSGVTIYLLSEDRQHLVMQFPGLGEEQTTRIEKLIRQPIPEVRIPKREGSWYWEILESGQAAITQDPKTIQAMTAELTENPTFRKLIPGIVKAIGLSSVITVPLTTIGETIGLIDTSRREPFNEADLHWMERIAGEVSAILQHQRMDVKLTASEDRYRDLVENSRDLICTHDLQGVLLIINPRVAQMLGYQINEMIGKNLREFLVPEVRAAFGDYLAEIQQHGAAQGRMYVQTRSGEQRIWEYNNTLRTEGVPEPVVRGMARDITEKFAAEEKARKWAHIFEHAEWGVVTGSADGTTLEIMNPAFAHMHGHTVEELTGQPILDVFAPESRAEVPGQIRTAHEKGHHAFESKHIRKDGSIFPVIVDVTAVKNRGGQVLYRAVNVIDITERVRAERELEERRVYLEGVLGATPNAIVTLDENHLIVYWNPGAESLFGYSPEEVIGKNIDHLITNPDTYENATGITQIVLGGKKVSPTEAVRYRKDASPVDVIVAASPILVGDELIGVVAIYTDITARVQAQELLQRRNRELALLNRVIAAASTTLEPKAVLETTCRELALAFDLPQAAAALLNEARTASVIVAEYLEEGRHSASALDVAIPLEGNPATQYVVKHKAPLAVADAQHDPRMAAIHDLMRQRGTISVLILPLITRGRVVGTLGLDAVERREFSDEDIALAANAAAAAAQALENARLFSDAKRRLGRLGALHAIDQAISASVDINLTTGVFLDQVLTQLEVDAADVLLFDPYLQTLECVGRKGFRTSALQHTHLRLGQGLAGQVALQRKIKSIPDLQEEAEVFLASPELSGEKFRAYYGIPLVAKGLLKGVLEIFHRSPLSPDGEWLGFLDTLAGQAAIAIDNAIMFTDLQRSNLELGLAYDSTLEGWARALELRDMETEGHSRRVTEMTMRLARAMGIGGEALGHVRRGALLHDIGKMGIPDSILLKPGPLTNNEWSLMRQHPVYARDMLAPIAYLRRAIDIPYSHHEKWDGSGYPEGLRGEQIPLSARIFAIVDVWDALNSDRPYREAWPEDKVLEYIREQSGKHFDPRVVEAFFEFVGRKTGVRG